MTALLLTAILLSSCVKPSEDEIATDKQVDSVFTTETKMIKTTATESTLNETTTEATAKEKMIEELIEENKTPIPPECIKAYREYFNNFDFNLIKSFSSKKYLYIGDINNDGFPEVVIPFVGLLYYYENEIHILKFLEFVFFQIIIMKLQISFLFPEAVQVKTIV